jgi:hypothetical protein
MDKLEDGIAMLRTIGDLTCHTGTLGDVDAGDLAITLRVIHDQIREAVLGKAA